MLCRVLQQLLISRCHAQEANPSRERGQPGILAGIWCCLCVSGDSCCLFLSCILQCSPCASHTKLCSCIQLKGHLKSSMTLPCAHSQWNKDSTFSSPTAQHQMHFKFRLVSMEARRIGKFIITSCMTSSVSYSCVEPRWTLVCEFETLLEGKKKEIMFGKSSSHLSC